MGRSVIQELGFTVDVVKAMLSNWDDELESENVNIRQKRYYSFQIACPFPF